MNRFASLIVVALAALLLWQAHQCSKLSCPGGKCPAVAKPTKPIRPANPCPLRRPWGDGSAPVGASVGRVAPDGTEPHEDLPGELHRRNTSSFGLGNCVWTSIHHAALWQGVPALEEFPKWLIDKRIPGGGYPGKVADLIPRICKDRGLPVPAYIQVQGDDLEVLRLACRTGRMPAVTYSVSPTGRYGGSRIAHMVNIVHADEKWFAVLDNNYIGEDKLEWMTPEEFLRAYSPGWAVILLDNGPPPPPKGLQAMPTMGTAIGAGMVTSAAQDLRRWDTSDPTQYVLRSADGKQLGTYFLAPNEWANQYRRLLPGGEWSGPEPSPIPLPHQVEDALGQGGNFGIESDRIASAPAYSISGKEATRGEVLDALRATANVPDDSALLRLTIIGPDDGRARVSQDLESSPDLAPWRGKLIVKSYPPNHWAVARTGFVTGGNPTVYVQLPSGEVIHRQDDYSDGPAGLAAALRRVDPNYHPEQDQDARKSDPLAPLKSIPPWGAGVASAGLLFALTRRK